jgi:hypothetical protein
MATPPAAARERVTDDRERGASMDMGFSQRRLLVFSVFSAARV